MNKPNLDELLADYPVYIRFPLHWGEMDAYQHVNNVAYFRYFESARIAYFAKMDIGGSVIGKVGPILASVSARYLAPLVFPDSLRVGSRVTDVQEDRFTMQHAVLSESQGRIVTTGEDLIVPYDYAKMKKAPLPQSWRDFIRDIEAGREPRAGADE